MKRIRKKPLVIIPPLILVPIKPPPKKNQTPTPLIKIVSNYQGTVLPYFLFIQHA